MTSTAFSLIGSAVMFGAVVAMLYGKISRRTAGGLLVIGGLLLFIGIVLAAVLAALAWFAVIMATLVAGRYAVRSAKARHAKRADAS